MKKYFILVVLLLCISTNYAQTLSINKSPLIWLRADIPGDTLNQWQDISGNNYNAHIFPGQMFPFDSSYNYHPAFYFATNSEPLEIDFIGSDKENLKVFIVYQAADTLNEYGIWGIKLDSNIEVGLSTLEIINKKENILYNQTNSTIPTINALSHSWRKIAVDSNKSRLLIGGSDSLNFHGKIAEFILFDKRLSSITNKKVHTYLALKYGITLNRLDYVNSNDKVVFQYKKNKVYLNDVAGIARDDSLQLYQKQSSGNGGNSELTISVGSLQKSNDSNHCSIANMDYLIWGHNGDTLAVFHDSLFGPELNNLLSRKWLISMSGISSSQIETNIKLDASQFDTTGNLVLVINQLSDNIFDPNTSLIFYPDSVDDNQNYYFSSIFWDTDSSGSDMFTFMIPQSNTTVSRLANNPNTTQSDNSNPEFECLIFPNPSDGDHLIEIHAVTISDFTIKYYDAEGRLIDSHICNGEKDYSFRNFIQQSGVYLISVENSEIQKTFKLIIK